MPCATRAKRVSPAECRITKRPSATRAGHRARRGRPRLSGLVVADEERLGRGVGHGVVREGREAVLAAVLRPGVGRARGRDHRPERGVGDDVGPGQGRLLVAFEDDHVVAPVVGEAAHAVGQGERRHRRPRAGAAAAGPGAARGHELLRLRPLGIGPVELVGQLAPLAAQDGARHAGEEDALGLGHAVPAQQVGPAGPVLPRPPGSVVEEGRERRVHLVEVAHRVLVEDHDVGAQPLEPPVLLRLQDLAHERQVVLLDDPHQEDGEVARDAVGPEAFLAEGALGQELRARAERSVGIEHPRGQALEEQGLLARDAEVAEAALRMREGEGEGPRRGARLVVALGEGQGRLPGGRHARGEGQPHEAARREANALPQADDGVEHEPGRAGEGASVERLRVLGTAPAAQEARAVGLPFHRPLRPAFQAQDVNRPRRRLVRQRAAADGRAGRRSREGTPSRRTACRRPGGPGRRPAGRGRSRRSS